MDMALNPRILIRLSIYFFEVFFKMVFPIFPSMTNLSKTILKLKSPITALGFLADPAP